MGKAQRRGRPGNKEEFEVRGGFLEGLAGLVEKLGELAEKGGELRESGQIGGPEGKVRGVYGFTVKVGLGEEGLKVEPFGNVRKDARTGAPVVSEVREPLVDIYDEEGYVLVLAEMPGVGEDDVKLDLKDDILSIKAEHGDKKYSKEVLLPASLSAEKMAYVCRNGMLEVKFTK
jgi:HSP20 family protein